MVRFGLTNGLVSVKLWDGQGISLSKVMVANLLYVVVINVVIMF